MKHPFRPITAAAAVLVSLSAQAVDVTALPGSTVYSFPVENYSGTGPRPVAPGITWTSQGDAVFGNSAGSNFLSNGSWDAGLPMIGTDSDAGTMTLTFHTAVVGVGAYLNWARNPDGSPFGDAAVLSAYDATNTLLESYTLTFDTGGADNSGEFHGFLRSSAEIKSLTFGGAYIGAKNLEVVTAAVPEPQTYGLMLAGLVVVGAIARRRRNA